MSRPNFLIVGVTKAGTTTLQRYLAMHPDIYMCATDLHFFSHDDRYRNGYDWYLRQFQSEGQAAIGEKSPTYSWEPLAPDRIRRFDPDMKLIWILREPVARSYSHYWQMVRAGDEYLRFERCVERKRHCIMRSVYADQVQRYLNLFDLKQMFFMLFESLVTDPKAALEGLFRFLGVRQDAPIESSIHARRAERYPRYPGVNRPFYQLLPRTRTGERVRSFIHRRLSDTKRPAMGRETGAQLRSFFEAHNERLRSMTGLDVSCWEDRS